MKKALLPFVTSKNPQHHQALIKNLTEKMNFFGEKRLFGCASLPDIILRRRSGIQTLIDVGFFFGVTFFSYKKFSWRKPIINLDLHNTQEVWQH